MSRKKSTRGEIISLDNPVDRAVLEQLPDHWTPEEFLARREEAQRMEVALETILQDLLTKDEQNVFALRNDLFGNGINSWKITGKLLTMSVAEVKMLEDSARLKLRGFTEKQLREKASARDRRRA